MVAVVAKGVRGVSVMQEGWNEGNEGCNVRSRWVSRRSQRMREYSLGWCRGSRDSRDGRGSSYIDGRGSRRGGPSGG